MPRYDSLKPENLNWTKEIIHLSPYEKATCPRTWVTLGRPLLEDSFSPAEEGAGVSDQDSCCVPHKPHSHWNAEERERRGFPQAGNAFAQASRAPQDVALKSGHSPEAARPLSQEGRQETDSASLCDLALAPHGAKPGNPGRSLSSWEQTGKDPRASSLQAEHSCRISPPTPGLTLGHPVSRHQPLAGESALLEMTSSTEVTK